MVLLTVKYLADDRGNYILLFVSCTFSKDNLETYLNHITILFLVITVYILHKHRNLSEMLLCGCNLQRSYHKGYLFYVKA